MSKQVLDIEQMQHLKDLGVDTSNAMMCYRRRTRDFRGEEKAGRWNLVINQPIIVSNFETYEEVPTFTLQDILELLPYKIIAGYLHIGRKSFSGNLLFFVEYPGHVRFGGKSILDAAYEMLCWCIENGYIETKKQD